MIPAPTDLRVENARDPLGLDEPAPRLSWTLAPAIDEQRAYRIRVARDPDLLADGGADVWDSGRVASARSVNVRYDGPALRPGERYHWTVRVWDFADDPSAWSEPARWETGLLADGWTAAWIGRPDPPTVPDWTDYDVTAAVTSGEDPVGVAFRASGTDDLYCWQLAADGSRLRLLVRESGEWRVLKVVDVGATVRGEGSHTIGISVRGATIETTIDGVHVDTTVDDTHPAGSPGIHTGEGATCCSFEVRGPSDEPWYADDFDDPAGSRFPGRWIDAGRLESDGRDLLLLSDQPPDAPSPLFRTAFDLDGAIERARAYVAGLGFHELSINGERIGDGVLSPGRTDFDESVLYAVHDVGDALREGPNAVGVALGRARYGELSSAWGWDEVSWWSDPELRLQIEVELVDGTRRRITSDGSWLTADGPTRFDSLFAGETYDAREEQPGWTDPGFDDASWERAVTVDGPDGALRAEQSQEIGVAETLDPVAVETTAPGVRVYDFGRVLSGWPLVTVEGERGEAVRLSMAEKREGFPLDATGGVDTDFNWQPLQEDRYVLGGGERETWEPHFTYHGFRYVAVEATNGDPSVEDLRARVVHTRLDDGPGGEFACSNDLLETIHERTRRSILSNAHSVPTDTPMFEKMAYGGDGLAMATTTLYNYPAARFYRKWLRDLADAQADGLVPSIAPAVPGRYEGRNALSAGWGSVYVLLPWWLYRHYGDRRVLERHYDGMAAYVDVLRDQAAGLVHPGGFGDYNSPGSFGAPPEGSSIVGTSYLYRDAAVMAETARVLGRDGEAATYRALAGDVAAAFNDAFLENDGYYATGETDEYRQTSNVMPLAFGIVPADHEPAVVDNLAADVRARGGHLDTGVHGLRYLLSVLSDHGHHELAYDVATAREYPSWGYWFEDGFTGLLEDWDIHTRSRSLNHQYFGSIDGWFFAYLAGIRPAAPGYERVEIAPRPAGDLSSVAGSVETVRGTVAAEWQRSDDRFALEVSIPGNTAATASIPGPEPRNVTVRADGRVVWAGGAGVDQTISHRDGRFLVDLAGGSHTITRTEQGETVE